MDSSVLYGISQEINREASSIKKFKPMVRVARQNVKFSYEIQKCPWHGDKKLPFQTLIASCVI
jgi:hypothetical protein